MGEMSLSEAVELGAIDSTFFCHRFFPKSYRQKSAPFDPDVWALLEDPEARYVAAKMFRGSAKTTRLRTYVAKRISYGISRTILFIGKSEEAASKSLDWLKRAVEYNKDWSMTFGLEKGEPWTGTHICIRHTTLGIEIRVLALGILGSTRGVNIDDYRPDLIIVDDPCDEENTATAEQRTKISNLFFGAIKHSLAPRSESPEAKMVLLQTPLNGEDLIESCMKDSQWRTISISCFTEDGRDSSWAERFPYAELMEEKKAHIARNQLSLWMREMEVTITSTELSYWKAEWLKYWDILPEGMMFYMGVDPTPPPKDSERVVTTRHDDAVVMVIGLYKGDVYVVEYWDMKSPDPGELMAKIFEFYLKYKPRRVGVETVLFQRMLKWALEQKMRELQVFFPIFPVEDKRKKSTRIVQSVGGRATARSIYCRREHYKFIEQFGMYSEDYRGHDDVLDAFSIALLCINPALENYIDGEYSEVDESNIPALPQWRAAP